MTGLSRTLGLPMLVFYGTGMILGAGIYSIIGKAAASAGETLWLGFVFAGIAALLTALSYAELVTMYPKAGAEFVYLRKAFPKRKWIGASIGLAMAFSGAATAATVVLAFAGYLNQFWSVHEGTVAISLLCLFTGLAIIGIRESGWVTVGSTLIEVGGLAAIIYFGVTSESFGERMEHIPHAGTFAGTALIIFSFFGFENIVNLAEETKEPQRDLPRAILVSVVLASAIYLLVSISALTLLPPEKLAQSKAPLMAVAQTVSSKAARILGAVALFSTANTALISLIGASRILYGMGKDKALPAATAHVIPKRKTPWIASLIVLAAALLLLPLGELETVASVSSLATIVAFFSVNVALIVLRFSEPRQKRSFRVPLQIGKVPVLPLLAALICLALLTQFALLVYVIVGSFFTVSALVLARTH